MPVLCLRRILYLARAHNTRWRATQNEGFMGRRRAPSSIAPTFTVFSWSNILRICMFNSVML